MMQVPQASGFLFDVRTGQSFPGPLLSEDFVDFEVIP
jgi:hypothetical protein